MVDQIDEIAAETTRQLGDREDDDFNVVKAQVAGAIIKGMELERERCAAELEKAHAECATLNLLHGAARIRAHGVNG